MNASIVDKIAAAVLYEGYILYPYRPALKNRQRWTFGGVYPRAYSNAHGGSDAWTVQTECLVEAPRQAVVEVRVRFLHLSARTVGELPSPLSDWPQDGEPEFRPVETLQVGEQLFQSWQEAVEREVRVNPPVLGDLVARPHCEPFTFPSSRRTEPIGSPAGDEIVGGLVREQQALQGAIVLSGQAVGDDLFRIRVSIRNETALADAGRKSRDEALMHSFVSTHTILHARNGRFISLIDPPDALREVAAGCRNIGAWPVLVGEPEQRDTMLSAPIILYDYPEVAPESPGDLFDATEIDELLTLRILTLTDDEKRQMACVEEQTRALLQRTESLGKDDLLRLHGTFRGLKPPRGGAGS